MVVVLRGAGYAAQTLGALAHGLGPGQPLTLGYRARLMTVLVSKRILSCGGQGCAHGMMLPEKPDEPGAQFLARVTY